MENDKISIDNLLTSLNDNNKKESLGSFEMKELTLKDQKSIISASFEPISAPAKISIVYNDIINQNVIYKDGFENINDLITIKERPYILNILRKLCLGEEVEYENETYKLPKIKSSDLKTKIKSKDIIKFNNFTIKLKIPNLKTDTTINKCIINELNPIINAKERSQSQIGDITNTYIVYELIKYIDTIIDSKNDITFNFNDNKISSKIKIVNSLPQGVVNEIMDFITEIKKGEEECFKCKSNEDKTYTIPFGEIFFNKK